MTIEELIKEYKASKKVSKKHLVLSYMPYSNKISFAKGIIDASSYEEINGKKTYKRNTPTKIFLFSTRLVETYTDVEFDRSKLLEEYDSLVSSGVMNELLSLIPTEEMTILQGMLDMIQNDIEENTRSLVSFLETKAEAADIALTAFLNIFDRPDVKAKISEIKKASK